MVLEDSSSRPAAVTGSRVALVTGGSRGIVAAIAVRWLRSATGVIVNYHRSEQRARDVATAIHQSGGQALTFAADVTDAEAVSRMVNAAEARLGVGVDILVNNASGPTAQSRFS